MKFSKKDNLKILKPLLKKFTVMKYFPGMSVLEFFKDLESAITKLLLFKINFLCDLNLS